jgi:hypothetical protein
MAFDISVQGFSVNHSEQQAWLPQVHLFDTNSLSPDIQASALKCAYLAL